MMERAVLVYSCRNSIQMLADEEDTAPAVAAHSQGTATVQGKENRPRNGKPPAAKADKAPAAEASHHWVETGAPWASTMLPADV